MEPDARSATGRALVINGQPFDPSRVDANPRLDDIELRFVNRGFLGQTMLHPVYTHLTPFQILRRNGGMPCDTKWGGRTPSRLRTARP